MIALLLALGGAPLLALGGAPLLASAGSPLLELAERLRCAEGETSARAALRLLREAQSGALGLPDERLHQKAPPSLRAGTLDLLAHELHLSAAHFPALREQAAQLIESWEVCPLEGGVFDLVARERGLTRTKAAAPFPAGGAGFEDAAGPRSLLPPDRRACWKRQAQAAEAPRYPYAWTPSCPEPAAHLEEYATATATANATATSPPQPGAGLRPSAQERPAEVPVPGAMPAGGGIAPAFVLPNTRTGLTPYAAWLLEGRYAVGVQGVFSPFSHLFVRGGLGYRAGLDHTVFDSWGLGYDDFRPGSFSLQINDWGPALFAQGLDWQHAVVDLGYKPVRLCAQPFCVATYLALDVPLQDTAFAVLRATTTWREVWFVRVGLDAVFDGHLRWVYGFGRADWHAFAVNLSYDNWGPNPAFQPAFKQHGIVTLSLNL